MRGVCPYAPTRPVLELREGAPASDSVGRREQPSDQSDERDGADRWLCCAACEHEIASDRARIEVAGAHEHTCMNPHGYAFTFGCFDRAPGAQGIGEQTAQHSWFPGFRWQLAHCRRCGAHLGWRFCTNTQVFFGLIADRLIERG